jgi:uncharacterized protein (DUF58 family)
VSLPPEIVKKVKLLELNTRKLVNNLFAGQYHSAFKGQGMTFAEFREYVPGDDVRTIAWPLTARTGKTFVKKFDEERELTLMLVVDVSGSQDFGSTEYFKGEVIAHLAALLSFSASKNNDQVGLLLFSDQVEHFVPPKKGRGHVHRILRDLYYFKPRSRRTNMAVPIEYLLGVLKKRSTIFVFSDFIEDGFDRQLRLLGRKHDTIAVVIQDPAELILPDIGVVEWHDAESGEILAVDTSSRQFRRDYEKIMAAREHHREGQLRRAKVDRIDVNSAHNIVDPLVSFFQRRQSR